MSVLQNANVTFFLHDVAAPDSDAAVADAAVADGRAPGARRRGAAAVGAPPSPADRALTALGAAHDGFVADPTTLTPRAVERARTAGRGAGVRGLLCAH